MFSGIREAVVGWFDEKFANFLLRFYVDLSELNMNSEDDEL